MNDKIFKIRIAITLFTLICSGFELKIAQKLKISCFIRKKGFFFENLRNNLTIHEFLIKPFFRVNSMVSIIRPGRLKH